MIQLLEEEGLQSAESIRDAVKRIASFPGQGRVSCSWTVFPVARSINQSNAVCCMLVHFDEGIR